MRRIPAARARVSSSAYAHVLVLALALRARASCSCFVLVLVRHTRGVRELRVLPGPGIPGGLSVPANELMEQFSHSSGPGGQGVNTSDSRVQLALDIATTTSLDERQRARVLAFLDGRLSGTVLVISASEHRSQLRNRTAARDRMAALLREAVVPEAPRRATRPTAGSRRRRLEAKRIRSTVKRQRRRPGEE